ncbi:hypothetical protein ACGVWS_05055 [Enterobacteriaceae bacterium LUAb1]
MGLKGRKLGEWPELAIQLARENAVELFAELSRFWKYSAPQLCNGRNVTASIRISVESGALSHTFEIGTHTHSVSGTTANTGSGSAVSVKNAYIKLMGWYRRA